MYKGNRGAWKQQNLGEESVYRANEGSLKTAESREMELLGERARGFWKLPNPGRPICVRRNMGEPGNSRIWRDSSCTGGREREKPENS